VTATHHPDIGRIKDMGSAAVGFALAIAALPGCLRSPNGWPHLIRIAVRRCIAKSSP